LAADLAGIQPGEIVGPFEISSHYVVLFRCLGRKEAAPLTYENTKDAISRYLEEMEFERLKQEVIERAKKRFDARIFEDRLAGLTIEQSPRTSN